MADWRDKNFEHDEDDFENDPLLMDPNLKGYRRNVPEHTWDEEFSTDMTYDDPDNDGTVNEVEDRDEKSYQIVGWFGVVLSLLSFFLMPVILAAAGIILGVISRNKRTKVLGNTAIVISIVSLAYFLFLRPMIF